MGRKDKISVINQNLSSCEKCKEIENPRPFYFSKFHPDCKVMVITWKPSIQAIYRPLFSTRFFRVLCLALFGANPRRKDFVELFNTGEIFWTHLQKCYTEQTNETTQQECSGFYIKREFSVLKPTLELIIVLGDMAKEYIQKQFFYDRNKSKYNWCFAQLPKTGKEDEFLSVRQALSGCIHGIDVEPVPDDIDFSISFGIEDKLSKHAAFCI